MKSQANRSAVAPSSSFRDWLLNPPKVIRRSGEPFTIDEDRYRLLESYEVPPATVHILHDKKNGRHHLVVEEPALSDAEAHTLAFVQSACHGRLIEDPHAMNPEERRQYVLDIFTTAMQEHNFKVDDATRDIFEFYILRDLLGFGRIDTLMRDDKLEDISCNGPKTPIFVFHRTHGNVTTNIQFQDHQELDGFVVRLAQNADRSLTTHDPVLDAALSDGSRLQATFGHEVTSEGSTFTIRRITDRPITGINLVDFGSIDTHILAWMWLLVEHHRSMFFAGGTASGKTTLLNAVSRFIPPQSKIVTIEDTREVRLPHRNWIPGVTRVDGNHGNDYDMHALLKAALRQRPEYIIVGEVRSKEARVAFDAMATGHAVMGTMHAESPQEVKQRLTGSDIGVPLENLASLDTIIIQRQLTLRGQKVRRVDSITEIIRDGDEPSIHPVFTWDPESDTHTFAGRSYILESIARMAGMPNQEIYDEFRRRDQVLRVLVERGINTPSALQRALDAYVFDPKRVHGTLMRPLEQGSPQVRLTEAET